MQIPVQITFQGVPATEATEALVREQAARLERFSDRVTSCRVVLTAPHRHRHTGRLHAVRVLLTLPPRREIVVSRHHAEHDPHVRMENAVRDAFSAAIRRLEDHVRLVRGQVKAHEGPQLGHVVRLVPEDDFGFLETVDGDHVYFHRHSVAGAGFDDLAVGDQVAFDVEPAEAGPNATAVRPLHGRSPAT